MKKIYLLVVGCVVSASVFAQSSTGLKFGVRGGVSLTKFGLSGSDVIDADKDAQKSVTTYHIGGYVEIPVSKMFSIQPGLTLSGNGGKEEYEEDGGAIKNTADIMYLEVPVNGVVNFKNFYLGAGPYFAFALGGKLKSESSETVAGNTIKLSEDRDLEFGNKEDKDDLKSTDFGINVLAGYQLLNGINFGVNYGLGLANLSPASDANYKVANRGFSLSVGFKF